jgi:hypothetical protein
MVSDKGWLNSALVCNYVMRCCCLLASNRYDTCFLQTLVLALLMRYLGSKHSIIIGLVFEMLQLFMLGFGSQPWYVDITNRTLIELTSLVY